MKKVLIITYYWPPASGPGVQRWLKMSGFLPDFGWMPTILTTEGGSYPSLDYSLEKEVDPRIEIYRTLPKEPFSVYNTLRGKKGKAMSVGMIGINTANPLQQLAMYIRANYFIPDARKGWNISALPKAIELHQKESFDAIVTTGPPHSTHLIGLALKEKLGVKWLADLRDPWVNIYYNKIFPRSKKTILKDQAFENAVLEKSDVVTVVSPGLKEEFENRSKRIEVIYNGYDEMDFEKVEKKSNSKFVISYIGNLKPNQNIKTLWEAISDLCISNSAFKDKLCIRLTGNIHPQVKDEIIKNNLLSNLETPGFMSHDRAVQEMVNANLLLFIIPKTESNYKILTGKLFEYLASQASMLSIGPKEGNAANIIRDCGRASMMGYDEKEFMIFQIEKEFELWQNGKVAIFENSNHENYTRKKQAQLLIQLL